MADNLLGPASDGKSNIKGANAWQANPGDPAMGYLGGQPDNLSRMNANSTGKLLSVQLKKNKSTGLKVP
jgi:hypothetical protein